MTALATAMNRYSPTYHAGDRRHCDGCGSTHWHIGRSTAECATCGHAMPLAEVAAQPVRPLFYVRSSKTAGRV